MDVKDKAGLVKPKVAVIGAGATGLVTARHLKDVADVQVFESKEDVGGLWKYTNINEYNHPDLENDVFYQLYGCLHGSIYQDLMTNNPKQWMTFKDFWISKEYPNLMTHQQFYVYLQQYAEYFGLYEIIKFGTTVKSVKVDETAEHKFTVITAPNDKKEGTEETINYYDYVIVWNGQYSVPKTPKFEGEDTFEGKISHIHSFRRFTKEEFEDKVVLLVGWSFSGCDIAEMLYLTKVSDILPKKIVLLIKPEYLKLIDKSLSEQVENNQIEYKLSNIFKIKKKSVIFEDGSEENIDTIIYATGYLFCFPFIDPDDKIIEFDKEGNRGEYFGPLYKKMFSINHPNLIFMGMIQRIATLYLTFERQAQLVKQYIIGELTLPTKEDMLLSLEEEKKICSNINLPLSKFYQLNKTNGYSYDSYHKDLCELSNLPINHEVYNSTIKAETTIALLNQEGKACKRKMIDWDSVYEDFDYNSSSDKF